ncbi:MAG TPA: hypothetical protein VLV83_03355 [Acidobacteriota bacterium]|nr:hypothetical protein [Acidobacteriota bacterium]
MIDALDLFVSVVLFLFGCFLYVLIASPVLGLAILVLKLSETRGVRSAILITGTALSVLRATSLVLGFDLHRSSSGYGEGIGFFMALQVLPELGLVRNLGGNYALWLAVGISTVTATSFLFVSVIAAIGAYARRVTARR